MRKQALGLFTCGDKVTHVLTLAGATRKEFRSNDGLSAFPRFKDQDAAGVEES